MTLRPCIVPNCPNLTDSSRCPAHRLPDRRGKSYAPYNSPAFRAYRRWVLATRPVCHICNLPGSDTVDHLTPVAHGGASGPWLPAHRSCNSRSGSQVRRH